MSGRLANRHCHCMRTRTCLAEFGLSLSAQVYSLPKCYMRRGTGLIYGFWGLDFGASAKQMWNASAEALARLISKFTHETVRRGTTGGSGLDVASSARGVCDSKVVHGARHLRCASRRRLGARVCGGR